MTISPTALVETRFRPFGPAATPSCWIGPRRSLVARGRRMDRGSAIFARGESGYTGENPCRPRREFRILADAERWPFSVTQYDAMVARGRLDPD